MKAGTVCIRSRETAETSHRGYRRGLKLPRENGLTGKGKAAQTLSGIAVRFGGWKRVVGEWRSAVRAIALACALVSGASRLFAAEATQYWQLTFSYDAKTLTLLEAGKIPPLQKQIRTPGLTGAPVRIAYHLAWLDSKQAEILSTPIEVPLGGRVLMADGLPCQSVIPPQGVFVLRVKGPADENRPKAVRLTKGATLATDKRLAVPQAFQTSVVTLPITKPTRAFAPPPGPISATKIRNTGGDGNRLVIVVMGDGYTSADLAAGIFTTHANNFVSAFGAKSPWTIYFAGTNIYRVDIESRQQGADQPPLGIYVDTYLNATFWTGGMERLLTLNGTGVARAIAAADSLVGVGVWDSIFVLVNSTKYGGSGGFLAVSSIHASYADLIRHEFGHSFADLADEYDYGGVAPPPSDSEPNVDFDSSGTGLKWLVWVESGTPLPTPDAPEWDGFVGAFEGASYFPSGIFRPWRNCLMRVLGRDFCPVCQEAHAKVYTDRISLADSLAPPAASVQSIGSSGTRFVASPAPISPLTYQWKIGGRVIASATSSTLLLTQANLTADSSTLELRIAHLTSLVRRYTISRTYQWTVLRPRAGVRPQLWRRYE